jgi:hypothetical protein
LGKIIGVSIILAGILGGLTGGLFLGGLDVTSAIYGGIGLGIFAVFFTYLISFSLLAIAEGVTVVMIKDAFSGNTVDLSRSWNLTKSKIGTLIFASILLGIIVSFGYLFLILPGVILGFLLYFIVQAIIIDDKGAVGSLLSSYRFVRANMFESAAIYLVSLAILYVLSEELIWGSLLYLIAMPFITSLATLFYLDRS